MNILHLKYAVEVAKTSSLNKAAENLFVSQPNLSRAVKELEESLGITIFRRTSKGMFPTEQGEVFLQHAKEILAHIEEVESMYNKSIDEIQSFSATAPRASYIGDAFIEFSKSLRRDKQIKVRYEENNQMVAVKNIVERDFHLGIIRFRSDYNNFFETMLYEKGLKHKEICEFSHNIVISEKNPLSQRELLTEEDLEPLILLSHGDPYVPGMPVSDIRKAEISRRVPRRICIYDRATQFDLLSSMTDCYIRACCIPERILKKYGLKTVRCATVIPYKDVLIYKKEYSLSRLDKQFLKQVEISAKDAGLDVNHLL